MDFFWILNSTFGTLEEKKRKKKNLQKICLLKITRYMTMMLYCVIFKDIVYIVIKQLTPLLHKTDTIAAQTLFRIFTRVLEVI